MAAGVTAERQGASMLSSSTPKCHMIALVRLTSKTAFLVASLFPLCLTCPLLSKIPSDLVLGIPPYYSPFLHPFARFSQQRTTFALATLNILEPAHAARQLIMRINPGEFAMQSAFHLLAYHLRFVFLFRERGVTLQGIAGGHGRDIQ